MRNGSKIEKPYYNKAIEAEINSIIPAQKYKEFTTLLRDMFHRRAYEFGLTDQEIVAEARNFAKNVDTIEFVPKKDMLGSETAMGVYSSSKNTIRINQDFYMDKETKYRGSDRFAVEMYSTLVHEVYHAINDHSDDMKFLGLSYYDSSKGRYVGTALNEVFTETAANRASHGKRIEDADRYRADTDGYGSITFASNLLAAGLGVSEKEILRAGIQHRGKLDELILDQFPLDDKFGARARDHYIGNIEAALDSIYNIEYNHDDNKKPPKPKEQEMKKSLIISGLATMFDNTYRLANFQIGVDTQDFSREMASSVNYRFRKIEKIMDDMMQYYSGKYNFSKEEVQAVYDSFNEPRMGLGNRAVALDLLTKQGHKIKNPGEFERQVSFAKRGITFSKENMEILNEGYGIDFQGSIGYTGAMSITTDLGYDDIVLKEDYDQGLVWDNESAGIIMRNIYRENMIRKGFRTREQYILQEMPTEEMPIVEPGKPGQTIDPDKTEEIPVVDPDKTEEIPIVDPDNSLKNSKLSKMLSGISNAFKSFMAGIIHRDQKKLPEAQSVEEVQDNSSYYAKLASQRNDFDNWVRVDQSELTPLGRTKSEDDREKEIENDENIR